METRQSIAKRADVTTLRLESAPRTTRVTCPVDARNTRVLDEFVGTVKKTDGHGPSTTTRKRARSTVRDQKHQKFGHKHTKDNRRANTPMFSASQRPRSTR